MVPCLPLGSADLSPVVAVGGLSGYGDLLVPPTKWTVVTLRPPCATLKGKSLNNEDIGKMVFWGCYGIFLSHKDNK